MIDSITTDSSYDMVPTIEGSQARTRVMSPTPPALTIMQPPLPQGGQLALPHYDERNSAIISGMQARCEACQQLAAEPSICAACGHWGHAQCMRIVLVQGFPFCCQCLPRVQLDHDQAVRSQAIHEWKESIKVDLSKWKITAAHIAGPLKYSSEAWPPLQHLLHWPLLSEL